MKIKQSDINYVESICEYLPQLLHDINNEIEKNDYYIYASKNRAKFDRLRLELSEKLLEIKKVIYGGIV